MSEAAPGPVGTPSDAAGRTGGAAPDVAWTRGAVVGLAAVLLAVLLAFLPAFRCDFVQWDDNEYVTENPLVAHPDIGEILLPSTLTVGDWTPLVTLSHAAERALFGAGPAPVHAVNVALHVLSVALLAGLLRRTGLGWTESLLAAFLFGVHPLQVESVAWVSARKNLLCIVLGFAFLRDHLDGRPIRASVWLALAMMSKGTAVSFPLIAAAATWLGIGRPSGRAAWTWIVAWTVAAAGRGLLSATAQAEVVERVGKYGLAGRMATMGVVLATQARQFVAPTDLALFYEHAGRSFAEPAVLGAWAVVGALAALVAWTGRRDRRIAFAGLFVVAALAPTLNVFPSPYFQADRYAHVAIAGVAVLAVAALRPLARAHAMLPGAVVTGFGLAVLLPATVGRIGVWRTNEDLWNDTCLKAPGDGLAWAHLGSELLAQNRTDDAIAALSKAVAMPHPEMHVCITNLAIALQTTGRVAEARAMLERLLAKRADAAEAHAAYGAILHEAGERDAAWTHLDLAMQLKPRWPKHAVYRAEAMLREGHATDARAQALEGVATPSVADACRMLASAADALDGRPDEAFARLRAAWAPSYSDADVWAGLGDRVLDLGRPDAAEALYRRAIGVAPSDGLARFRLAIALSRRGDAAAARDAAREAVSRAKPDAPWLPAARELAK